eukprot:UN04329
MHFCIVSPTKGTIFRLLDSALGSPAVNSDSIDRPGQVMDKTVGPQEIKNAEPLSVRLRARRYSRSLTLVPLSWSFNFLRFPFNIPGFGKCFFTHVIWKQTKT